MHQSNLYSLNTSIFVFPQYIYMFRFVNEMLDFINCYDISRSSVYCLFFFLGQCIVCSSFLASVLSVLLSWPLCCLFFFVLRLLITPLVSSNFPYLTFIHLTTQLGIHLKLHYLSCCRYFYVNDLGYKDGLSKYRSGEHFR